MAEKGGVWYLKLGSRTYRDEKLKAIREETGSTDFFEIWIAFLCLAVCEKRDGSLYISDKKPYTPRLLANEIGFSQERTEEAIKIFQEYDMITVKKGVIWLNNWSKYQNVKTAEEYKAKDAERSKKYRDKKKAEKLSAQEQKNQDSTHSEMSELSETEDDHTEMEKQVPKETKQSALAKRFERWYKVYPKKQGRGAAEKAFEKYKPDDQLTETMIKAVEAQKNCRQWKAGYIPNPATWLNQKRWLDEIEEEQPLPFTDDPSSEYYRDERIEDWN